MNMSTMKSMAILYTKLDNNFIIEKSLIGTML